MFLFFVFLNVPYFAIYTNVWVQVNEYYDDPYLYLLSGNSFFIERLNVSDAYSNKWEALNHDKKNTYNNIWFVDILDGRRSRGYMYKTTFFLTTGISYDKYIYLLCSYSGYDIGNDDIYMIDVSTWQLHVNPIGDHWYPLHNILCLCK